MWSPPLSHQNDTKQVELLQSLVTYNQRTLRLSSLCLVYTCSRFLLTILLFSALMTCIKILLIHSYCSDYNLCLHQRVCVFFEKFKALCQCKNEEWKKEPNLCNFLYTNWIRLSLSPFAQKVWKVRKKRYKRPQVIKSKFGGQ